MSEDLLMSAQRLKSLPAHLCDKVFTFIVGSSSDSPDTYETYQCNLIGAYLLSSQAGAIIQNDPTANKMRVDIADPNKLFGEIMKLASGESVPLTLANADFFMRVGAILGYKYLSMRAMTFIASKRPNSVVNIVDRLRSCEEMNIPLENYTKYAAEHFDELNHEEMVSLETETLDSIFSQKTLVIENEESLYMFMKRVVQYDNEKAFLLKHIRIQYLKNDVFADYIAFIEGLQQPELITNELWGPIRERLLFRVYPTPDPLRHKVPNCVYTIRKEPVLSKMIKIPIEYQEGQKMNGLFHRYSNTNSNSYIAALGYSCSSYYTGNLQSVFVYNTTSDFRTNNIEQSWIQIDFKEVRMLINGYSLQTPNSSSNLLKSWKLEGSNDEKNWELIDTVRNDNNLRSANCSFYYKTDDKGPFRYVRITQIETNRDNDNYFALGGIEFFGIAFVPDNYNYLK